MEVLVFSTDIEVCKCSCGMSVLIAYAFSKTQYDLILPLPGIMRHKNAYLFTLEYRIIGRFGIIAWGGGGGLETFPKINYRGFGIMGGVKK